MTDNNKDARGIVGVVVMCACFVVLSCTTLYCTFVNKTPYSAAIALFSIVGMVIIAIVSLVVSGDMRHVRARQSNRTLSLASETVTFMRQGLSQESAQAVCDILLPAVTAVSVAITDRENILGFAGVDKENHEQGTPIQTEVTKQTLQDGQMRVAMSAGAVGFQGNGALIEGAIIVPLIVRKDIVGTLKFYYTSASKMDEDQQAMAEGFAQLLSTQVALSYLEQQTELATRMELKALQAQINPHFLFNTINTIASYTRTDPEKARVMLREFAVYYRRLLENSEDLIPLYKEIDQVERYLMFQRARFGESSVEMTTEMDQRFSSLRVPAFILQPLVENAVGHGRRADGSTLHIRIRVHRVSESVIIEVQDDGVGIAAEELPHIVEGGSKSGMGIALKNVNARLRGYFGALSGLHIKSTRGVGTTVTLTLYDALGDTAGSNLR